MNAHACSDKSENVINTIKCAEGDNEYTIFKSEAPGDLTRHAKEQENSIIFSLGGDGTIFETVNGMAESSNAICPIPAGSGNDFCRILSNENNYRKVLLGHKGYSVKKFDCGKADDLYFANIASIGFDAEVVANAQKFKHIPGLRKISYIIAVFYTLFTFRGSSAKITIDGNVYDKRFLLCAVANGRYYGGGIDIVPIANPRDGLFDVLIVDCMSMLKLFFLLPTMVNGKHIHLKVVHVFQAKKVTVESDKPFILNLDGELFERKKTEMKIIEKGLNVYC